jgi:hypothetical protein
MWKERCLSEMAECESKKIWVPEKWNWKIIPNVEQHNQPMFKGISSPDQWKWDTSPCTKKDLREIPTIIEFQW